MEKSRWVHIGTFQIEKKEVRWASVGHIVEHKSSGVRHRQFQATNRRQAGTEAMLVEREAASTDMVATVAAASIVAVRGYSSSAMVPV